MMVGKDTLALVVDIANIKLEDLNTTDVQPALRTIAGTARSMGIEVEG
jgi:large subunit ribosomal protein L11